MTKRSRDNTAGRAKGLIRGGPQGPGLRRSISYRLRELLSVTVGEPYDRDPCPAVLRTADEVPDLTLPNDPHRRRTRYTDAPCVRPRNHGFVDKVYDASSPEALHADATGRTWA
jgi:hypothetical protein